MLLRVLRATGHHILLLPLHVPGDPAHEQVTDTSAGSVNEHRRAGFTDQDERTDCSPAALSAYSMKSIRYQADDVFFSSQTAPSSFI